jgi:hypothetical protein
VPYFTAPRRIWARMKEEEINRDGQDEQDKSKAEKALLRFQI